MVVVERKLYHYHRPYIRQLPMFTLPEGVDPEEELMLQEIDTAESALKAQRRIIGEYEKKANRAAEIYAQRNYGKKKGRRTWYR